MGKNNPTSAYVSSTTAALTSLFISLYKRKALIIFAFLVGLFFGSMLNVINMFRSRMNPLALLNSSFAVTAQNEEGLFSSYSNVQYYIGPNANDYYLAESMTEAVIYVAESDLVLDKVIVQLNLIGTDAEELREHLTLTEYDDTQIIEISFTWGNAEEGLLILEKLAEVLPDILVDTLKLGNVAIVNPPKVVGTTIIGFSKKVAAIFSLLGAFVIVAWCVLDYLLFPTVLESAQISEVLRLPLLGEVPWVRLPKNAALLSPLQREWIPRTFYESIQYTANCLLNVMGEEKILIVSSAMPWEGKTTVTSFLAYILAERGKKVLLLDLNTRSPQLGTAFSLKADKEHCVNAVASGETEVKDALVKINKNLDLLPCIREDEPMVIDLPLLEKIRSAAEAYDLLLVDSSAMGEYSDTLFLNHLASRLLLVIQQEHTPHKRILAALQAAGLCRFEIAGVVFNERGKSGRDFGIGTLKYDVPGIMRRIKREKRGA